MPLCAACLRVIGTQIVAPATPDGLREVRSAADASMPALEENMNDPESKTLMPYSDASAADDIITGVRVWLERAVIGLNLCPFAKAVYSKDQVRFALTAARSADELLAELAHELELLARLSPRQVETALLIHPQALTEFLDYHFFLAEANASLRNLGFEGVFQLASFHPGYEFAGSATDDIENYTNRSPYPMLHLLREESIDRAVAAYPDAAEVFEKNVETMRRLGHAGWQRLWVGDQPKR
jgi:uncharacterized protein